MPLKFMLLIVGAVMVIVICLGFLFMTRGNSQYSRIKLSSVIPAKPSFGVHYVHNSKHKKGILSNNDIRTINKTLKKYSNHIEEFNLYLNDNLKQEPVAKQFNIVSFEGVINTIDGPQLKISANGCAQKYLGKTVACKIKNSLKQYYRIAKDPAFEGRITTVFN